MTEDKNRTRLLQDGKDVHWALGSHTTVVEQRIGAWTRGTAGHGDERTTLAVRRVMHPTRGEELQISVDRWAMGRTRSTSNSVHLTLPKAFADLIADACATIRE
jgi:hypothetical protein